MQLWLCNVYLYPEMHLKAQGAVTRRWLCSLWIVGCKCMKKASSRSFSVEVARSVVAAGI